MVASLKRRLLSTHHAKQRHLEDVVLAGTVGLLVQRERTVAGHEPDRGPGLSDRVRHEEVELRGGEEGKGRRRGSSLPPAAC